MYIQYLQGFRLYYVVFIHQRAFVSLQAALFLVGGGSVIPQAGTASSLFEAASRSGRTGGRRVGLKKLAGKTRDCQLCRKKVKQERK